MSAGASAAGADEFDIIARHFAPLATSSDARGLRDDAALLAVSGPLVITTDAIVEGVHFLSDDPIDTVARKALRVNISDLVAKGARPIGVLLTLIWPDDRSAEDIALFAQGLGADLREYGVTLLGGDTTRTPGPLTVSVTALGAPLGACTPARADARIGDDLWVTGAIGDAGLGLATLRGAYANLDPVHRAVLVAAYRTPAPPVAFAPAIAAHAHASMDISDGLAADAAKMAAASGLALRIEAARVPVSDAARALGADLAGLMAAGDDYQALFTAAPQARDALEAAAAAARIALRRIGAAEQGAGVRFVAADGSALALASTGHVHRLGGGKD